MANGSESTATTKSPDEAKKNERPKKEWPICFENGGANYVFDPKTGFYYEAASKFYYDVGSKLYYGSYAEKYYTYAPEKNPPFVEYTPPIPIDDTCPPMEASKKRKQPSDSGEVSSKKSKGSVSFGIKLASAGSCNKTKEIAKWNRVQQQESTTATTRVESEKKYPKEAASTTYNCLVSEYS